MIDMRGEEEAALQPHSQVRHELMHNQYNKMREEENHWQDVSVALICFHMIRSLSDLFVCDEQDCFLRNLIVLRLGFHFQWILCLFCVVYFSCLHCVCQLFPLISKPPGQSSKLS